MRTQPETQKNLMEQRAAELRTPGFVNDFLGKVDCFIANNWKTLPCSCIHLMYSEQYDALKHFRGNSAGFTGYSEFLLFRFLYHQLGGQFVEKNVDGSEYLHEFVASDNSEIRIGQSIPVKPNGNKIYPDIVVWKSDKLLSVAQIKLYLTNGANELEHELINIDSIHSRWSDVRALLITYSKPSEKQTKLPQLIHEAVEERPWFQHLSLKANPDLLFQEFEKSLLWWKNVNARL